MVLLGSVVSLVGGSWHTPPQHTGIECPVAANTHTRRIKIYVARCRRAGPPCVGEAVSGCAWTIDARTSDPDPWGGQATDGTGGGWIRFAARLRWFWRICRCIPLPGQTTWYDGQRGCGARARNRPRTRPSLAWDRSPFRRRNHEGRLERTERPSTIF